MIASTIVRASENGLSAAIPICPPAATKKALWPSQNVTGFASRSTATLPGTPNRSLGKPAERAASSNSDRPVVARCRCGDLAVGGGSSALVTCGHGAARSWIDGYEMAVNGLDAYPLPRA